MNFFNSNKYEKEFHDHDVCFPNDNRKKAQKHVERKTMYPPPISTELNNTTEGNKTTSTPASEIEEALDTQQAVIPNKPTLTSIDRKKLHLQLHHTKGKELNYYVRTAKMWSYDMERIVEVVIKECT